MKESITVELTKYEALAIRLMCKSEIRNQEDCKKEYGRQPEEMRKVNESGADREIARLQGIIKKLGG